MKYSGQHQEKNITNQKLPTFLFTEKNQAYWVIMCVEAFLLHEKIWLIFVWLTFTLFFCKAIMKDAVKQIIGFLGC